MLAAAFDADPSGITVGCPALPSNEAAAAVMAAISSGVMSAGRPAGIGRSNSCLGFYRLRGFVALKIAGWAGSDFRKLPFPRACFWHSVRES